MADSETIKANVLKLQNANAEPRDIEDYVRLATAEPDFKSLTQGTVSQAAGALPTKEGLMSFVPKKEEVPELVGSMAGMFARRTPLGMGLAAGGAALGEGVRQIAFEDKPLTPKERLQKLFFAGVRGGLGEGVGRGIGRMLTPFAGGVTPEIKAGKAAAERAGVKLPLSSMTQSPKVQSLERFAEYSLGGPKITAEKKMAINQLENFANKISDGLGANWPEDVIGETAAKRVKNFEQVFKKTKDTLYEPINKVLSDKPVNPENTLRAINDVLDQRAGGKEGRALLQDWAERLSPGASSVKRSSGKYIPATEKIIQEEAPGMLTPKITETKPGKFYGGGGGSLEAPSDIPSLLVDKKLPLFKQLKAIRSEIGSRGNFNDPGVTGIKADLERIYAAASQDMDNAAQKYGVGEELQKANSEYSKGIKKLQDTLIQAINKRAEKSPESLHKFLIRNNSPTLIKTSKEILGEEGFSQIRKQWFDDLVNRSKTIVDGEEVISPAKLANNIRKVGSSLDEITSDIPGLQQKLLDLSDVSKALTRGRGVTSGSQTGFIMSNLLDIRNLLAVPLVQTNLGRSFLTTGFPKIGNIAGRAAQVGTQLGLERVSQ